MTPVTVITLSFLISAAISAPLKETEESVTLFKGEDFHILLPSQDVEVTFKNRSDRWKTSVLMRGGKVISTRVKPTLHFNYINIEGVGEGDEGLYILKDSKDASVIKQISLIVRDCTLEQIIKYGGNFHIPVLNVNPPITLEYKPSSVEANLTSRPAIVVLTAAGFSTEPYQGRITVGERSVTVSAVTGVDEGSYTVRDNQGVIKQQVCLNVKEHTNFVYLPADERLKINLILNSSLVQLHYTRDSDSSAVLLMDKGEFTSAQADLGFKDRLSVEGSMVFLNQIKNSDAGLFKITDLQGFTVSTVHLGLKPYQMETLYVAIIALLGLLAFLLLVCLLSCLIKVKKRAKRAAALEKLAQNAGKEDEGEAFRQVVKNITKLSEESKHSQADNTEKSQSTEVDIKGLEVSSKEVGVGNLETSDSGVGFNTALPLDTDTDVPDQIPDSETVSISVAPEIQPSPPSASESKPAAPPVPEPKASPVPETKKAPDPPVEAKLDTPKPVDAKLSPTPSTKSGLSPAETKPAPSPSPEPKTGLSPADPKPAASPSPEPKTSLSPADPKPAPTPSPELKISAPAATTPTPDTKSPAASTPEPTKPSPAEPITNGTPEPGPDSKASPDHAEIIKDPTSKEVSTKTHEVELKSSSVAPEGSKDGAAAEGPTTT
ncbi:cadherin-related family member 5 isoform X2 [Poecilia formosa]|uniref:cadherin-related family member 5 isoform X1 n=1 Tax=Poecilia formosa TaxID=48698 RepID=UPI0004448A5B|nr:PREDICTED: cadherin-related family member 5-like isoform X1 [Poecilia formosa]XP_007550266.1 PREDICTED: cadherin-related family member 5-like isoform X1 [Poecilia formosa]XP_016525953.1 PREDICTED: cadherin-related family member 5-like isoform X2 [Poecilia formosa]